MRQGDGSDLPGVSRQRKADIGIIYVAPNDDRQSVLAAILTQDKLGRKQVVVVLPEQNRAFQRPVDFDGLKGMRRSLKAQIVFIAPSGPGPADFARQRRFPVYSSLENYAQSLQDGSSSRKSWLPIGRQKAANTAPTPAPPQESLAGKTLEDQQPGDTAAVAGAAAFAGMEVLPTLGPGASSTLNAQNDWDTLPPAVSTAQSSNQLPGEELPTEPNTGLQPVALAGAAGSDAEPKIIELSQQRSGTTGKLRIPTIVPVSAAQPQVPAVNQAMKQRSSGKMPVMRAASLSAGATSSGRTVRAGGTPPTRGRMGTGSGGPGGPRRGIGRLLLIALGLLLLTLLIVYGVLAYTSPGTLGHLGIANIVPGASPAATITITPTSADQKNTYTIFGVTQSPDPAQRQVQARLLSSSSSTQSKTVNATGVKQTPGVQATGTITFYNNAFTDQQVNAGTTFILANGIQIITDRAVDIPAATGTPPNIRSGSAAVSAHAGSIGTAGNIAALTINKTCCSTDGSIFAKNLTAFAGGQDPQNYTFVQQSDINGAATPLVNALSPEAQKALQSQIHTGEHLIATAQCSPAISSDHAAGDKASSVTVTVKVNCSGEVYDQQAARSLASNLLSQQATKNLGPGYALVGNVLTNVTEISVTDASKGTLELLVSAEGIWAFQFSDAQKQALAKLVAGKSKKDAQTLLLQQPGVSKVSIEISGGDGNTLPTDSNQISVVVQSVPGLQGSSGPTTGPGSPTVPVITPTSPTVTPTPGLGKG